MWNVRSMTVQSKPSRMNKQGWHRCQPIGQKRSDLLIFAVPASRGMQSEMR